MRLQNIFSGFLIVPLLLASVSPVTPTSFASPPPPDICTSCGGCAGEEPPLETPPPDEQPMEALSGSSAVVPVQAFNPPPAVPNAPFLQDWRVGPPPFLAPLNPDRAPSVTFSEILSGGVNNYPLAVLFNRNSIISRRQYPNGACLEFNWAYGGGEPLGNLRDSLAVSFRTDGRQRAARSWEIRNGIVVKFFGGAIKVESWAEGAPTEVLAETGYSDHILGWVPLPGERIRIIERNNSIEVYLNDQQILATDLPPRLNEHNYVSIYNREPLGAVDQHSHISYTMTSPNPGGGPATIIRALPAP